MKIEKSQILEFWQIPEEDRKGHYETRTENSWDYSRVEEVTYYIPTDEEKAMVKANVEADKARADKLYYNVPEETKDAIGSVLDSAMERISYNFDAFDKIDVTGAVSTMSDGLFETYTRAVEKPQGPGAVMSVNVRGIEGSSARINNVELMKRRSIVDGLDMLLPPEAQKPHMNYFLSLPFLHRDREHARVAGLDLGVLIQKLHSFTRAIVTHDGFSDAPFAPRQDVNDTRMMLDRNNTKTPDNFHERNIAATREFLLQKPEYATALFLWVQAVTDYCRDLKSYVRTEMGPNQQQIAKEAPFWDTIGLLEGGNLEQKHFVDREAYETGKYANIDHGNKIIPTTGPNSFFYFTPIISAVMGALLEESGITHRNAATRDIDPAIHKAAFDKLSLSGIFQRGVLSQNDQPVLIRCPMSKKLGEWLTIDLGEDGKPEDQVLARFVQKVREDLASPDYNMAKKLTSIIKEDIENRMSYRAEEVRAKLDAHAARCPFHNAM